MSQDFKARTKESAEVRNPYESIGPLMQSKSHYDLHMCASTTGRQCLHTEVGELFWIAN